MEVPSIINKTVINKYIRRIYLKTKGIKKNNLAGGTSCSFAMKDCSACFST